MGRCVQGARSLLQEGNRSSTLEVLSDRWEGFQARSWTQEDPRTHKFLRAPPPWAPQLSLRFREQRRRGVRQALESVSILEPKCRTGHQEDLLGSRPDRQPGCVEPEFNSNAAWMQWCSFGPTWALGDGQDHPVPLAPVCSRPSPLHHTSSQGSQSICFRAGGFRRKVLGFRLRWPITE